MKNLFLGTLLLALVAIFSVSAQAQQTIFTPTCTGTASTDTAAFTSIKNSIGATNTGTIRIPYKASSAQRCKLNNFATTANITIDNSDGTGIFIVTGQTLTIVGPVVNPPGRQIFFNATASLGTVTIAGTGIEKLYPQWWGAFPTSSGAANNAALQAAIKGAGTGNIGAANRAFNRVLVFTGWFDISTAMIGDHTVSFRWEGVNKLYCGIRQTATNTKILDADGVAYGNFYNMTFQTSASQNTGLVDLYNAHDTGETHSDDGNELSPQNIRFKDCVIQGNGVGYIGVWIARVGGGSQGDNVSFEDCYISGFLEAGAQLGGGTGVDYAYNAINVHFTRGDIQSCPKFGLASYGGNWVVQGTTMENQTNNGNGAPTQTGMDVNCEGAQRPCVMRDIVSESPRIAGGVTILENIQQQVVPSRWYTPNGGSTVAQTSAYVGQAITGTYAGGDGKTYVSSTGPSLLFAYRAMDIPASTTTVITDTGHTYVVNALAGKAIQVRYPNCYEGQYRIIVSNTATTITLSSALDFAIGQNPAQSCAIMEFRVYDAFPNLGGLGLTTATGGSATTIAVSTAAWTVDSFIGYRVSIMSTIVPEYCVITGNSATVITCAGGFVTDYDKVTVSAPGAAVPFVVEPNWNGGTVTLGSGSNTVTLTAQDFNSIGPDYYAADSRVAFGVNARMVNLQYGGRFSASGVFNDIRVTRNDWMGTTLILDDTVVAPIGGSNVTVLRVDGVAGLPWAYRRNNITGYTSSQQIQNGTAWTIVSAGDTGGGSSYDEVGWGRGDGAHGSTTRNIFGILGTLGRKTPFGTNQNGADLGIEGGLPTGSGTSGLINFYTGPVAGASGTTVRDGSRRGYFDYLGLHMDSGMKFFGDLTGNVTGTVGASSASTVKGTTVNATTGFQNNGLAQYYFVTTDFTTAANTSLQLITGLTWTVPANTAMNFPFQCFIVYSQGTANVGVNLGIQDVTVAPTNIFAAGTFYRSNTALVASNLPALTTTTATNIVGSTPTAVDTNFNATLSGFIEHPSNASSSAIQIMVSTATAADAVTIRRGSFCRIN